MEIASLILGLVEKLIPIALDAWAAKGKNSDEIKARLVSALMDTHAAIGGLSAQFAADDDEAKAAALALDVKVGAHKI